jgi:predicted nucleic acid-binding protein
MERSDERLRFVVDASVASKWYLTDEEGTEAAAALLDAFGADRVTLFAPEQIRYEVPSAFLNALRRRRWTTTQARQAIEGFLALPTVTIGTPQLVLTGFDQTLRYGCSLYDGLYVALAEMTNTPLIHADAGLRNALADRFPLAIWLADLRVTEQGL